MVHHVSYRSPFANGEKLPLSCFCAYSDRIAWFLMLTVIGACDNGVNCNEHATCSEVDNLPVCTCIEGYLGDGFNCEKGLCDTYHLI